VDMDNVGLEGMGGLQDILGCRSVPRRLQNGDGSRSRRDGVLHQDLLDHVPA
jgi:hypothetical protein